MRTAILLLLLVLVVLAGLSAAFAVDRSEYVYVTQFGRHIDTYDGATQGGLHWKLPWPVQSVQRIDSRLQYFDLPETELLTHDPKGQTIDKTLTVVAYVCWKVSNREGVDLFLRRVGTPDLARKLLGERINGQLGAAIGKLKMDDLFNTDPGKVEANLEQLRQRLLYDRTAADQPAGPNSLVQQAHDQYGIDVVDVRLRRTSHPRSVRDAIYARIRSEREKKVAYYDSEGTKLARDIASKAEREAVEIKAQAEAHKRKLEGQADAEADRIRNDAHSKDPEFYAFLKKL
ncbi:MAG: protease modulator HflC, partial [Gemmataceae bacterium]